MEPMRVMQENREIGRLLASVSHPVRDPGVSDAVRVALTRILCDSTARQYQGSNALCRMLAYYATTPLVRAGRQLEPPHPDVSLRGWPTSDMALRRLGTTAQALQTRWRALCYREGPQASLDSEELAAFFPPQIMSIAETLLVEGPAQAAERCERALFRYGQTIAPANKRRRAAPISRGTVQAHRDALVRLFRSYVAVRHLLPDEPALVPWIACPKIGMPKTDGNGRLQTDGPDLRQVRRARQRLTGTIDAALRCEPGESERAAYRGLTPTQRRRTGLARPLRVRLALDLFLVTGARIGELEALNVSDYLPHHVGPAPDQREGPALRIRLTKKRQDLVAIKHLPRALAEEIEFYHEVVRSTHQRRTGTPAPHEFPLLVADCTRLTRWQATDIRAAFSGKLPGPKTGGMRPVVPRVGGMNPDLPDELRQFVGYNPHALRHTASQLAEFVADALNRAHASLGQGPVDPAVYAAALCDHGTPEAKLRATYGDRCSARQWELYSGRAALAIWDLITTDAGARVTPDVIAYRKSAALLGHAAGQLEYKQRQLSKLFEELRADRNRRAEALHQSLLEVQQLQSEIDVLRDQIPKLEVRLAHLRDDRQLWLVVPDDDEDPPLVDFDSIDREAVGRLASTDEPPHEPLVRSWLTTTEFADAWALHPSTVARWCSLESLPANPSDRPWDYDVAPVDTHLGLRYRRISIPHVKDPFLRAPTTRRRIREMLTEWPAAKGWQVAGRSGPRCAAPLVLPSCYEPTEAWCDDA